MRKTPLLLVAAILGLAGPAFAAAASPAVAAPASPAVAAPVTSAAATVVETVQAARRVMMNDPAAALAIGIDLERRAAGVRDARERRIMLARAKWIAGEASLRLGHTDEASRLIDMSYTLAQASGDASIQGDALLSRGSIKSTNGDPAGALQDYLAAYRFFLSTGEARSRSIALQYLSEIYSAARDFGRAETYLRQAAEVYRDEPVLQLALANNIGNLLGEQGHHVKAEQEYRRGFAIARDLKLHLLEQQLLGNLALAQIEQGHLADASRTIAQAGMAAHRTGIGTGQALRTTMARLAFAEGRTKLARQIMDLVFTPRPGGPTVLDEQSEFAAYRIYKADGDTAAALAHHETASRLRNEAVTLAISNRASLMAAQFDSAAKDLRIASLKTTVMQRDIRLARAANARERTAAAAVALAVLVLIAMLAAWLYALRRSRDRFRAVNLRIEQSNVALEEALLEVGERARSEYQARQLALHDTLTGLPNRRHLSEDFADDWLARTAPGEAVFVLLLDLDRFKPINDIHGHEIGDKVLVVTADRLRALCSRAGAKVTRLGGDEFVVVLSGPDADEAAEQLATAIVHEVGTPIYLAERRLTLGGSIGIARCPRDGTTIEDLLRAADNAMYDAKRAGRNNYRFFEPAMEGRERLRAV